jgi:hypothetical protein
MRGAFRSLRVLSPDMLRAFCLASVPLERKNLFFDLTGGDRLIRDVGLQGRPDEYCAVRVAGVGSPCETTGRRKATVNRQTDSRLAVLGAGIEPAQTFRFIGF